MRYNELSNKVMRRIDYAFYALNRTVKDAKKYFDSQQLDKPGDKDSFGAYFYKLMKFRDFITDQMNGFYDEITDLESVERGFDGVDDGTLTDEFHKEYLKRKRSYDKYFDWENGEERSK